MKLKCLDAKEAPYLTEGHSYVLDELYPAHGEVYAMIKDDSGEVLSYNAQRFDLFQKPLEVGNEVMAVQDTTSLQKGNTYTIVKDLGNMFYVSPIGSTSELLASKGDVVRYG